MAVDLNEPPQLRLPTERARRARLRGSDLVGVGGFAMWSVGLTGINLNRMGDAGLISVLPGVSLAGLALVLTGFVVQLTLDPDDRIRPAVYVVGLVVMLDGLPGFVEQAAGVPTGYIHAGFIDYILRHGHVLSNYDARFSWPGMFAWSALATVAGGRSQALVYLRWTPLVLDLLYLLPLRLILRTLCPNPKIAWMAAAVFVLGNWVEQDYFSPQGLSFLGFLSVLAVCLATGPRLERAVRSRREAGLGGRLRGTAARVAQPGVMLRLPTWRARGGVIICLTLVAAAIVTSHQLTPYTLLLDLVVLAVAGTLGAPSLVLISAVLAVGYLSIGAENFWVTHLSTVFGGVGQVGGSVQKGLVARTHVSVGHQLVIGGRLIFTGLLLGAGAAGLLLRRRRGDRWMTVAALAAAPWGLVAVQSYGGEVFLRSLFMSFPFVAIGVAEILVWLSVRLPPLGAVVTIGLLVGGTGALLLTRYGNEPFYLVTPGEIAAVRAVDRVAPTGSIIAVLDQNLPWRFEDIERYTFVSFQAACADTAEPTGTAGPACLSRVHPDYIIFTNGEKRYAEMEGGVTLAAIDRLEYVGLPLAGYRLAYDRSDAQVLTRVGVAAPRPETSSP